MVLMKRARVGSAYLKGVSSRNGGHDAGVVGWFRWLHALKGRRSTRLPGMHVTGSRPIVSIAPLRGRQA